MSAWWLLAACNHREPEPSTQKPTSCTDEVIGNGIDEACNGWSDELGPPGRSLVDEGTVVLRGQEGLLLGLTIGVGRDAHGDVWLGATADLERGTVIAARQPGGYEVHITAPRPEESFGIAVEIGNFDGLYAPIVASQFYDPGFIGLYGELPARDFEQVVAEVVRDDRTLEGYPGYALRAADIDKDGFDELVLSAPFSGIVRVLDGPVERYWSGERATIIGDYSDTARLGDDLGEPADIDGDGVLDLLALSQAGEGSLWVIDGTVQGEVALTDASIARVKGEALDDDAGSSPAAGDADGDGHMDLLAGSFLSRNRAGVAYLVLGPIQGEMRFADADARVEADFPRDFCGQANIFQPDVDGDGADDPIVGCPGDIYFGGQLPGRVQLYRGPQTQGVLTLADADTFWVGAHPGDFAGFNLDAKWDLTGDGLPDLAVAAPGDSTEQSAAGAIYVLPGPL